MIYNLVEADGVVARLDNDFNVQTGDWLGRVPQWIYQCLSDLNIYLSWIPAVHIADVEDSVTTIPDNMQELIGIEYNGARLDRRPTTQFETSSSSSLSSLAMIKTNVGVTVTGTLNDVTLDDTLSDIEIQVDKIRVYDASTIMELPQSTEYYRLIPTGRIETSFDEGIMYIHYYKFPAGYSERLNSMCPWIPDNEEVKEAAAWYLLKSLLQRGYKHPVYSIGNPNPRLDPEEIYKQRRKVARNRANRPDHDEAKIIDNMWNSMLYNVIADYR